MQADRKLQTFVANATPGVGSGVESRTRYLATPLVGAPLTAVEVKGGGTTDVPFIADASEGRLYVILEGSLKVLAGKTYHRVAEGKALYVPAGINCEALVETERFHGFIASFHGVKPGHEAVTSLEGMEYPTLGAAVSPRFTSRQTGAFEMSEAIVESGRYLPLNAAGEGARLPEYTVLYVIEGELEMFQHGEAQRLQAGALVVLPAKERAQIRAATGKSRVLLIHN